MNKVIEIALYQLNNIFVLSDDERRKINELSIGAESATIDCMIAFNNKYFTGQINP